MTEMAEPGLEQSVPNIVLAIKVLIKITDRSAHQESIFISLLKNIKQGLEIELSGRVLA